MEGADMEDNTQHDLARSQINYDLGHINQLPDEILEFILSSLPPYKDLESCALVCKRWNASVKNLVRRSKMNLHKGLVDFRLCWEVLVPKCSTHSDSLLKSGQRNLNHSALNISAGGVPSTPPIIAGRFAHSAVLHESSMYIFGGGSSSDTTFNDLWRFDLSTLTWERPLSMGSYPSPKGSASMVYWKNQLVLFGGWRYPSLHPPYQPWCLFDELHYYDLTEQRWIVRTPCTSPSPMAGHSATVHGDIMVVFGGYKISEGVNNNSNETWCFDLVNYKWHRPQIAGSQKPPPRYGQFQFVLDDEHLMILGGCGGPNSIYTDAWILDMSKNKWQWRQVPVRNKKYGASHMWCNPSCKVNSKLVVLGPTPNLPQDFQMMKHTRIPGSGGMPRPRLAEQERLPHEFERLQRPVNAAAAQNGPLNNNRWDNFRIGDAQGRLHAHGLDEHYFANRQAILNAHRNQQQHQFNNVQNNNYLQPRSGRVSDLHAPQGQANNVDIQLAEAIQNRVNVEAGVSIHINTDAEAANRLQRNLALGCRDNEPMLPKRFDELYEDPFRMAAFNVQNHHRPRNISKDHNERIRRMEEKMLALRNARRNALGEQKLKEPSPKRARRNLHSLFVCDLTTAMDNEDPHLRWVEYKDFGVLPGAPEQLILSTLVAGHGELILFGGVRKETLTEITHQVSNAVHFLNAPRDIV